jgi:hypothetical protein
MNTEHKYNRKSLALKAVAVIAAASVAAYSLAAPDYDRIRKDINVMVGIVKSSLSDSDDCRDCKASVSGYYLADQGVVFNVTPTGLNQFKYSYRFGDDADVLADTLIEIPGMVQEIIEDVRINIGNDDFDHWDIHAGEEYRSEQRQAREALRDAKRELREAARELREVELEAIHAEKEELTKLREREAELEKELQLAQDEHNKIQENLNSYAEKRRRDHEKKQEERHEKRQQQLLKLENVVLSTFCDYSNTIRNLPNDEKISIIVKSEDDLSNIYVFKQSALSNCDSNKTNVREKALSYVF